MNPFHHPIYQLTITVEWSSIQRKYQEIIRTVTIAINNLRSQYATHPASERISEVIDEQEKTILRSLEELQLHGQGKRDGILIPASLWYSLLDPVRVSTELTEELANTCYTIAATNS
jgi:hypothetical protein